MDIKTEKDVEWITNVLKANFEYAKSNKAARACFTEISGLMNDLIDNLMGMPKDGNEITKSAKWVFLLNVLMPMSFGIYVDFLSGNTPVCFMQLRMIIESMALYYQADQQHEDETFFYDKLRIAQEIQKLEKVRLSQAINRVDPRAAKLWRRCSRWMHATSLARKLVEHVARGGVPTWGVVMPMEYASPDSSSLNELSNAVFLS